MYDLSSLSDSEKAQLREALGGGDAAQDAASIAPVAAAVKHLAEKVDCLEDMLMNQLLNPISDLYNAQEREFGIKGIGTKYGEQLGPYKDFYSTLTKGGDLHSKLYEIISGEKKEATEWSDESEAGVIENAIAELKEMLEQIKGKPGDAPDAEPGKVEIEVQAEGPEAAEKVDDLMERVKAMKSQKNPTMMA
jgi:protein subunit release factor A